MKYVILWALLNIHNGDLDGPYLSRPYKTYTAEECVQAVLDKGVSKPQNGMVKVYECASEGYIRPTMEYTER
jgi:hypothetical protein